MSGGPLLPREQRWLTLEPIVDGLVTINGGFWGARQRLNREVTIPYGMKMLEESGTIENFRVSAGASRAAYQMPLFRDSDLYKVLEAIAWERAHGRDPVQEGFFASSVEAVRAAQSADGYINTYVQVVLGGERFGNPAMGHELYCAGHLMQASVADARTGGRSHVAGSLSDVANRFAQLLVEVMSTEQRAYVPGHPEIETALAEMYRAHGDRRLLDLAADLVGRRGKRSLSWHSFGPAYFQDDIPFEDAMTVRGHAVRALYLLAGATDVYSETGRPQLRGPILAQWRDLVSSKAYITGGVGARHKDEAFGDAYELPPDHAYCETCAAVALFMWNWRLLLLTGDGAYADLMERTLYNGFLAGVGLDGTSFFYENPLHVREPTSRQPWYDCACCPPNAMRLLSSLEHYIATQTSDGLQLHQYMSGTVRAARPGGSVLELTVDTGYPFDGTVTVRVTRAPTDVQEIALRLPGWASGASMTVGGRSVPAEAGADGYLRLRRAWSADDEILLSLPLGPRTVEAAPEVDGSRGCVAYERGPLVYCIEGLDLPPGVDLRSVSVRALAPARAVPGFRVAGDTVVALHVDGHVGGPPRPGWPYSDLPTGQGAGEGALPKPFATELCATPYYAWANRGATTMRVWVPKWP